MVIPISTSKTRILDYDVIDTLGKGALSTIYAVKDAKGQLYSLKHVFKEKPDQQKFLDQAILEHEISSKFDHGSLRKSFKIVKQRKMLKINEVFVLMEFVDGLTLEQHRPENILDVVKLWQNVAMGLHEIHLAGYVHADVKPVNIMTTHNEEVKIIDFGQSCPVDTIKTRIQGTPDYIAPEQVLRRKITPQTDIFCLGAAMYWCLTGEFVPTLIPNKEQKEKQEANNGKVVIPAPHEIKSSIPLALSKLIMECVSIEPRDRPDTMIVVYDRLELAGIQSQRNAGA